MRKRNKMFDSILGTLFPSNWLRRKYVAYGVGILVGLSLLAVAEATSGSSVGFLVGQPVKEYEVIHEDEFCEKLRDKVRQCSRLNLNHLKFYFSLFVTIAWGAAVRTVINTFELSIPYTVVLTITGLIIGMGSRVNVYFCETWSMYTKFARTPPEIILYVFLPVLLFESAFSMKSHIFMRSSLQILTVALPGMVITTFLTAVGCQQFMTAYGWTFNQAALFGAIVSATDPVAVVAILRESGTSETLSVMIEGESLLNDGVAILMYEIFKDIVENPDEGGDQTADIAIKFVRITLGGPTFGYLMAKITILALGSIFNDAATEITITLVSAYMTYFIGEFYLHVSGVMAVVILGVTISAESTAISPEVVHVVHQFWEMMSFLANTVLFVILGIVISETAINSYEQADGIYAIWLYFTLNVIRFLMLIMLSPLLSRVGYGIEWRNLIVMMWGGLRGAVGICLALEVFRNKKLCVYKKIGPKFLLQTAAVVILTLIINGSTTKSILDTLGITTLSIGKLQDMANAVRTISSSRLRSIAVMKHDRFLADSNWEIVHKFTHLKDPYAKKHRAHDEKTRKLLEAKMKQRSANVLQYNSLASPSAPASNIDVEHEPAPVQREIREDSDEFKAIMEETRLRVLKAYKISFWRQYEKGTLSEQAVRILVSTVEAREDQILTMIHCSDLRHNWEITGFFVTLRNKIYSFMYDDSIPPKPKWKWRHPFHWLTTQAWFHGIIYFVIFLNVFPIAIETHINLNKSKWSEKEVEESEHTIEVIDLVEIIFTTIYTMEFLIKWIGRGLRDYFSNMWNWIDVFVLIISLIELVIVPLGAGTEAQGITSAAWIKNVRLIRFVRLLRWFKPLFPLLNRFLESRINDRLFLGYDIGRGYVQAMEDTLKFLPQMTPQEKVAWKFQTVLYTDRLQTVKELALLQQLHSGVVAAVKTRHASRAICNQMRDELLSLKEDGLLNEKEFELLIGKIEENMTRLWSLPSSFKESAPEGLISHLSWVLGSDTLKLYFTEQACLQTFNSGETIYYKGDQPNGLHMIISGLVRLHYEPSENDQIQKNLSQGLIPNTEIFLDLSFGSEEDDYLGCGLVCGELGVLTNHARASSIRCETDVTLFHWPHLMVENAITTFAGLYDSMECRLWRSFGIKFATEYLQTDSNYATWTTDKIRSHLEQGIVPIGEIASHIDIPEEVIDCILIYGKCQCEQSGEIFTAPRCLPTANRDNFVPVKGDSNYFRVLIVADYEALQSIRDSSNLSPIQMCIIKGPVMKDMTDILGEENAAGTREGSMNGSRSTMLSRRSTLHPINPNERNLAKLSRGSVSSSKSGSAKIIRKK